jgi:hypothetical protein
MKWPKKKEGRGFSPTKSCIEKGVNPVEICIDLQQA